MLVRTAMPMKKDRRWTPFSLQVRGNERMLTKLLNRLRAHQLEKAIHWIERRRELALRHGRMEDARRFEQEVLHTRARIAALRN